MANRDYFYITNNKGKILKMELVSIFDFKGKYKYIVYCENRNNYYIAKLTDNNNKLITDISKKEISVIEKLLDKITEYNYEVAR